MALDGLMVAYLALGIGAVVPIYFGSMGSLKLTKDSKAAARKGKKQVKDSDSETEEEEEEKAESLSYQDALMFPVMGSAVLFGLYLLFRFFSKEYINYLLTAYFALLGTAAVTKALDTILRQLVGADMLKTASWNDRFRLKWWKRLKPKGKEVLLSVSFDYVTVFSLVASIFFTAYYVVTKNWIASNIFAEAFATSAIQLLDLDDFQTGMLLLSGLFFYDIFWVFGTEVMVSVAKNFDAPIKLLFPKDLFAEKLAFTMLGLGDIVIPGIFVALCLRFDQSLAKDKKTFARPYFKACLFAYVLGLATTVYVMHTFKAAQPALLYLSPACILSVLMTAAVRGELGKVFAYKSDNSTASSGSATSGEDAKKDAKKKK